MRNFVAVAVLVGLAIMPTSSAAQGFVIDKFHADIEVQENGTIEVVETIKVEFQSRKHGIYREIPFRYRDELGNDVTMPVSVKSVTHNDDDNWTYEVSKQGNVVNIRIGDADRFVSGEQWYKISYEVRNAIGFFEDFDELYWNVTGNYWKADIRHASASISIVTDRAVNLQNAACYTGRYGSSKSDCTHEILRGRAEFQAERELRAGEGLTFALSWDKGIVAEPTGWQKFLWAINLRENWVFIVPLIVLIVMFRLWYRHGRDPKVRAAIAVKYEPPTVDGKLLTPSQLGALVDETMDQRDLTATIIELGNQGYIELKEIEKEALISLFNTTDYELIQLKPPDDELSSFQAALMRALFPAGITERLVSDLKNKFYRHIPSLTKKVFRELVDLGCFATSPSKVRTKYALIGAVVILIGSVGLLLLSAESGWKAISCGVASGLIVMAFANAMPAKTRKGAIAKADILGFQEFLNRADKERLERLGPEFFYKYLPYAIALDVVDHWVDAFKDLVTEPPQWFVGHHPGVFHFTSFASSITTATSHLSTATFSAPRGSGSSGGSGGGGFSGGGGGGGGGGSW